MKKVPIDLPGFRPFRPLAIRSCVLRGYSEVPTLLVMARHYEREFDELTVRLGALHIVTEAA